MSRCSMNPGTGPDIDLMDEDEICGECDGTGEDSNPRYPWQAQDCEHCGGTRVEPRLTREDHLAHVADAQADAERIEA